MKIEVWTSDQNQEEVHHFLDNERNTYLFGMNRQLLGQTLYDVVTVMVKARLEEIDKKKNESRDSIS